MNNSDTIKKKRKYKGFLIVVEGLVGSGKTTLAKKIVKFINKESKDLAVYTKEPTNEYNGRVFKELITEQFKNYPPEIELKFINLDRKQHNKEFIIPALKSGKIVVTDRYFYSTVVYQSLQYGSYKWLHLKQKLKNLKPDMIIFTDTPIKLCQTHLSKRSNTEPYEFKDIQERALRIYKKILPHDITLFINFQKENYVP